MVIRSYPSTSSVYTLCRHENWYFPRSFDPITHGHTDIITRSLRVFDKVVVAVAPNPSKHPLFNLAERLDMVKLVMKDVGQVEVTPFDGLLVDGPTNVQVPMRLSVACAPFPTLNMNSRWRSSIENLRRWWRRVFLTSSEEYSYLSSTIIKYVAQHGGNLIDFFIRK